MGRKDHQLVAHVDEQTYSAFLRLAKLLGDGPSALLRKLAVRAIREEEAGTFDAWPYATRSREAKEDTQE